MQTTDIVQQIKNEGRREGWDEGRDEGRREGRDAKAREDLLNIYDARFSAVPREVQTAVENVHDEATLKAWLRLFATGSANEILAALAPKRPA